MRSYFKPLLLTTLLTACAVGPNFESPEPPKATRYTDTDMPAKTASAEGKEGAAQTFLQGQDVPADWWKLFGSEDLNKLVQQALANNPDLKAARASLRQAKETYYATRGDILPDVDASFSPTREKFNPFAFGEKGVPSTIFTLYNANVSVSYGLDLFGGTRREIEEAEAQAEYQRYELDAAYLTLTANVVTAAIQEASLRDQIKETQDIVDIETKQLNILQKQFEFGAIAKSVVLEQQATLAQAQTSLPGLQKQLAQAHNQLTVLTGKYTSEGTEETFDLDSLHLPESLPVSLPSKLVEQRPDIRASEELLHAASADIGVATANMLPQITLTGSYGFEKTSTSGLFSSGANVWSLGAGIMQPIFHGGQLLHEKRAAVAAFDKAKNQYQSTVLLAFANVANTLKALQYDADALNAQVSSEHSAKTSLDLSQDQFKLGAVSYPQLLDAEHSYQQARIGLVQAQAARLADTAALFQALGGSWNSKDNNDKTDEKPATTTDTPPNKENKS